MACNTGMPGVCAAGTTQCSGGGIVCNQNQSASTEVCDSVDNDCDGGVNEGNVCCPHSVCTTGAALASSCSGGCAASVCAVDPTCCSTTWDAGCVDLVLTECNGFCPAHYDGCPASACAAGVTPLTAGCDDAGCVATVCALDDFCCTDAWDAQCVAEVASFCGLTCMF